MALKQKNKFLDLGSISWNYRNVIKIHYAVWTLAKRLKIINCKYRTILLNFGENAKESQRSSVGSYLLELRVVSMIIIRRREIGRIKVIWFAPLTSKLPMRDN
jgi:hypothetical protein